MFLKQLKKIFYYNIYIWFNNNDYFEKDKFYAVRNDSIINWLNDDLCNNYI